MDEIANNNEAPPIAAAPDAHGQAAMLLVESLIHGLIKRSVLSVSNAIEIVDAAAEVKVEFAAELGDTTATLAKSLGMLVGISKSLGSDLPQ